MHVNFEDCCVIFLLSTVQQFGSAVSLHDLAKQEKCNARLKGAVSVVELVLYSD